MSCGTGLIAGCDKASGSIGSKRGAGEGVASGEVGACPDISPAILSLKEVTP